MGYQIIEPNTDPTYLDFIKHPIDRVSLSEAKERYKKFYKCSGLWNNGCKECTYEDIVRLVDWMCTGKYYESSDKTALFVHGYSLNDMY